MAIENLREFMILTPLIFNFSFWLYIYSQQKKAEIFNLGGKESRHNWSVTAVVGFVEKLVFWGKNGMGCASYKAQLELHKKETHPCQY